MLQGKEGKAGSTEGVQGGGCGRYQKGGVENPSGYGFGK